MPLVKERETDVGQVWRRANFEKNEVEIIDEESSSGYISIVIVDCSTTPSRVGTGWYLYKIINATR